MTKRRKKQKGSGIRVRCRDCNLISRTSRAQLFGKANPLRCTACGGMMEQTNPKLKVPGKIIVRGTKPGPKPKR